MSATKLRVYIAVTRTESVEVEMDGDYGNGDVYEAVGQLVPFDEYEVIDYEPMTP